MPSSEFPPLSNTPSSECRSCTRDRVRVEATSPSLSNLDFLLGVPPDKQTTAEESRICIIGSLQKNKLLVEAAESFNIPVVYSENGSEYLYDDAEFDTGFVIEEFEGAIFENLRKSEVRIWGPTLIFQFAKRKEPLPFNVRPLYCTAMQNLIICFAGFRVKEELSKLVELVHHMGGSIRKDFSAKITHVVANNVNSEKYKYATALGKSVLSEDWIRKTWEQRHDVNCVATDESLMKYRVPPFFNCYICFIGFSQEEEKHMIEVTEQNGGKAVVLDDASCSHIVVDNDAALESENFPPRVHVVKQEWFWASIQMEVCADVNTYTYQFMTSPTKTVNVTPQSSNSRLRKRKRLKETLGQLAQVPEIEAKRLSTELGTSLSDSFLDATTSPDKSEDGLCLDKIVLSPQGIKSPAEIKTFTARQQVCMELLQTETNYVNILSTITKLFKEPLESADHVGGPLLDPTEVKIIFGHLPPILEVHNKLRSNLAVLLNNWQEDCSVGSIILKHSPDLVKAYPPFINFFEKTKQMLIECDQTKPRFHAFLKICQNKPECGRQSLVELMIRPVQRLPSVILLLTDALKHTHKSNPDYQYLEEAIKSLKEVLTHINEDKRKTEGQVAMFDIVNDIENCPANLLSSHRNFVTKADMMELSDSISGKGDHLSMFLFTDYLEICKRRSKMASALKSPNLPTKSQMKFYKHIELMPLSHIKRVVNINETEECKQVFALVCRSNEQMNEKLYSFTLTSVEIDKMNFLKTLCRHMANTACRADAETFLITLQPHELDIETSDITTNSISKAMSRLASKTKKVGRAFSFNKTPRKLKRAVSTMLSPMNQSPYATVGHRNRMLPSQFPSSSILSLQEMDSSPRPHTFKISKKNKSNSFGASAAKVL